VLVIFLDLWTHQQLQTDEGTQTGVSAGPNPGRAALPLANCTTTSSMLQCVPPGHCCPNCLAWIEAKSPAKAYGTICTLAASSKQHQENRPSKEWFALLKPLVFWRSDNKNPDGTSDGSHLVEGSDIQSPAAAPSSGQKSHKRIRLSVICFPLGLDEDSLDCCG